MHPIHLRACDRTVDESDDERGVMHHTCAAGSEKLTGTARMARLQRAPVLVQHEHP